MPAPRGKVSWLRPRRNLWHFSLRHKKNCFLYFKISFFSHHPIFLDQSTQHTGFAPLFTQLTNEAPHFVLPFTNCTTKMAIFSPSLRNIIYPNFREFLWKSFKNTFWVTDFAPPPLALHLGTTVDPCPSLRHCIHTCIILVTISLVIMLMLFYLLRELTI